MLSKHNGDYLREEVTGLRGEGSRRKRKKRWEGEGGEKEGFPKVELPPMGY